MEVARFAIGGRRSLSSPSPSSSSASVAAVFLQSMTASVRPSSRPNFDHPRGFDVHLSPPAQTTRCRRRADAPPRQNRRSKDLHPYSDPVNSGIAADEDTIVMLHPHRFRSGSTVYEAVRVLGIGIFGVPVAYSRRPCQHPGSPCADATRPVRRVRSPGPCCCWRKPRPTPLVPSSLRPTMGGNRCGVACWR